MAKTFHGFLEFYATKNKNIIIIIIIIKFETLILITSYLVETKNNSEYWIRYLHKLIRNFV